MSQSIEQLQYNRDYSGLSEASNRQALLTDKNVSDNRQKTQNFQSLNAQIQNKLKEASEKEAEFVALMHQYDNDIKIQGKRNGDIDSQIAQAKTQLATLKSTIEKTTQALINETNKFEEQKKYKDSMFARNLANKDKIINDLNTQLNRLKQQYDKLVMDRIAIESEVKEKTESNIEMKDRIEKTRQLAKQQERDPAKVLEIQKLQAQNEMLKKQLEQKTNMIVQKEFDLQQAKDQKVEVEIDIAQKEFDKHNKELDLENQNVLMNQIKKSQANIDALAEQKRQVQDKIQKKQNKGVEKNPEDLEKIIDMIYGLNNYERTFKDIEDELRIYENQANQLIEWKEQIQAQHLQNQDKLQYTIGKHSGSTTGGLGFLMSHSVIVQKISLLTAMLDKIVKEKDQAKSKLQKTLDSITSKDFQHVTEAELAAAIDVNKQIQKQLASIKVQGNDAYSAFNQLKERFDGHEKRLKTNFQYQIQERSKNIKADIDKCKEDTGKIRSAFARFENELEAQKKMVRGQDKIDHFEHLRNIELLIKENEQEVQANLDLRKNQIDKMNTGSTVLQNYSATKLTSMIHQIRNFENSIDEDKKEITSLEQRLQDLAILFKNLVKQVILDSHNELLAKVQTRRNQGENLDKKSQHLQAVLEQRMVELSNIQGQLEDHDTELKGIFKRYQTGLNESKSEDEQVSMNLRQFLSQNDRLYKDVNRISKDNFSIQDANKLLSTLDSQEESYNQINEKLENQIIKNQGLFELLKDLEKRTKFERIQESEQALKIAFTVHDKLRRFVDRSKNQLNVIEKEQSYLLDEFLDMEKKKEGLSFKQEADKKKKDWKIFLSTKDNLRMQLESLEKINDERIRDNDNVGGLEFKRIKTEFDKIKGSIEQQIEIISGTFQEELEICKTVILKTVKKYRSKKEKFNECNEMRANKEQELSDWKDRAGILRDKIIMTETSLNILGVKEGDDHAATFQKLTGEVKRLKSLIFQQEKLIEHNQQRLTEECEDLELMEMKIVKTQKLEDIVQALGRLGIKMQEGWKEGEKLEADQRQLLKDVEQLVNKVKGNQLFDCEEQLRNAEEMVNQLIKKVTVVGQLVSIFKQDVAIVSKSQGVQNKDELQYRSEQFGQTVDGCMVQRDDLLKQLMKLKQKLSSIDAKSIQTQDISAFILEANSLTAKTHCEIKKLVDVEEELKRQEMQWKETNKNQQNKKELITQIQQFTKSNIDLKSKVGVLLKNEIERIAHFEQALKAMQGNKDYEKQQSQIEKRLRRIIQLRADLDRYAQDDTQIQSALDSISKLNLDSLSIEKLQSALNENHRLGDQMEQVFTELNQISTSLKKKRVKLADCGVRANSNKRKNEVQEIKEQYKKELQQLENLEQLIDDKRSSLEHAQETVRAQALNQILVDLQLEFQEFQEQFQELEAEVKQHNAELGGRDLEKEEPVSKVCKEIERVRQQFIKMKQITQQFDKLSINVQTKSSMMSSIDADKKIKIILQDIRNQDGVLNDLKEQIVRIQEISKSYDGNGSGPEDEDLFVEIGCKTEDMLTDFEGFYKTNTDIENAITKLTKRIDEQKKLNKGQLSQNDIEDLNDEIAKIENRLLRNKKQTQNLNNVMNEHKEQLAYGDLDKKLDRRKQELFEIDSLIQNNINENKNLRNLIEAEIAKCEEDPSNIRANQLSTLVGLLDQLEKVEQGNQQIAIERNDILSQALSTIDALHSDIDTRLDLLMENLSIKKRIRECLRLFSELNVFMKEMQKVTNEIFKIKAPAQKYKYVVGDQLDMMFAEFLNKMKINVKVERLGQGYYQFGSKKIFAKILNGRLVVRVGGGYMGIDEFIVQYGQQEADKQMLLSGQQLPERMNTQGDEELNANTPLTMGPTPVVGQTVKSGKTSGSTFSHATTGPVAIKHQQSVISNPDDSFDKRSQNSVEGGSFLKKAATNKQLVQNNEEAKKSDPVKKIGVLPKNVAMVTKVVAKKATKK